jgi:hypothetical protein
MEKVVQIFQQSLLQLCVACVLFFLHDNPSQNTEHCRTGPKPAAAVGRRPTHCGAPLSPIRAHPRPRRTFAAAPPRNFQKTIPILPILLKYFVYILNRLATFVACGIFVVIFTSAYFT